MQVKFPYVYETYYYMLICDTQIHNIYSIVELQNY